MTTSTKIATTVSVLALLALAAPLVSAQQPNPNATTTQQAPTPSTPGSNAGGNKNPHAAQGTKQGTNHAMSHGTAQAKGQTMGHQKMGQKTGRTMHGKNLQGKSAARGGTAMHRGAYGYRTLNQRRRHRQPAPAHSS
jgi:hypothetical protein